MSLSGLQLSTSGVWSYTLTMRANTDATRTQSGESNTEVWLDEELWLELKTEGLDEELDERRRGDRFLLDDQSGVRQREPEI